MSSFGRQLAALRVAAKLSQRGLARRATLTPAYVSLLEGGHRAPERATVDRLADALALSREDRAALTIAAGYAAAGATAPQPPCLLHDAETLLRDAALHPTVEQSVQILVAEFTRGLLQRVQSGLPLVPNSTGTWQQRTLEAIDEYLSDELRRAWRASERPLFDL